MPMRLIAITAAKPELTIATPSTQACVDTPSVPSITDSSANFAGKPGSGGRPMTSSAQPANIMPRKAIAAGIAMPASSESSYTDGCFTP
jgi:hypothetical protein